MEVIQTASFKYLMVLTDRKRKIWKQCLIYECYNQPPFGSNKLSTNSIQPTHSALSVPNRFITFMNDKEVKQSTLFFLLFGRWAGNWRQII